MHGCTDYKLSKMCKTERSTGLGMEAIEGLRFLASLPLAGTGRTEGGEKTQPFKRFHSRLFNDIKFHIKQNRLSRDKRFLSSVKSSSAIYHIFNPFSSSLPERPRSSILASKAPKGRDAIHSTPPPESDDPRLTAINLQVLLVSIPSFLR